MTDFQIQPSHYKQATSQKQELPSNQPAFLVSENKVEKKLVPQNELTSIDVVEQGKEDDQDAFEALQSKESEQNTLKVLQEKVAQLNSHMQNLQRNLQFTVDEGTGDSVVTVTDSETDKVIRQYPSEEILNLRNALAEHVKGTLLATKV